MDVTQLKLQKIKKKVRLLCNTSPECQCTFYGTRVKTPIRACRECYDLLAQISVVLVRILAESITDTDTDIFTDTSYYSHLVCKLVSSGFTMLRRIETCLTVCLLIYSGNSKCVESYTLEQNQNNINRVLAARLFNFFRQVRLCATKTVGV